MTVPVFERLCELIRAGETVQAACRSLGTNYTAHYYFLAGHPEYREQYLDAKRSKVFGSGSRLNRVVAERLFELLRQGDTIAAASRKLGIHDSTVHNRVRRHPDFKEAFADAYEAGANIRSHEYRRKVLNLYTKKEVAALADCNLPSIDLRIGRGEVPGPDTVCGRSAYYSKAAKDKAVRILTRNIIRRKRRRK